MKKRNPWIVPTVLLLVVTAVLGAAIPVTNYYETMINAALNAETQKIVPDPDAQIFYWTEYEDEDALVAHDMETCYRVEAEGAALLLNRDHTLPLPADTKFTLFSQSVADPVMTGTGSAFMATGDAISLYGALEASFAPGCVNTDLWKFYKTAGYKRENAKLSGGSPDQYRINEVPWEKYSDALKKTWAIWRITRGAPRFTTCAKRPSSHAAPRNFSGACCFAGTHARAALVWAWQPGARRCHAAPA